MAWQRSRVRSKLSAPLTGIERAGHRNNFHVGQKVVCVETWALSLGDGYGDEVGPVAGNVYTIRSIQVGRKAREVTVRLHEITNPIRPYYIIGMWEPDFNVRRFRPVKTTDISIFTAMLAPTPRVKRPTLAETGGK